MRLTKRHHAIAVCTLLLSGLLVGGCSDDDRTTAPVLRWKWAPVSEGLNAALALTEYDDRLIMGYWEVTAWDGTSLASLSGPLNGVVRAFAVFENRLIAGGDFTSVAGVSASRVAAWDGSTWAPLGTGMNESVEVLAVWNNKLIAGGNFSTAGGVNANRIAAWNGSSWAPLGAGSATTVSALTVHDALLIADIGPYPGAWNGSSWTPIPDGADIQMIGSVSALASYDGRIIVAGGVFESGSRINIASWDGSWHALGAGTNETIFELVNFDGKLVAAGVFTVAGGLEANHIASWDGASWAPLGTGMDAEVRVLTVWNGRLIAAGNFVTAGGVSVRGIAAWGLQ